MNTNEIETEKFLAEAKEIREGDMRRALEGDTVIDQDTPLGELIDGGCDDQGWPGDGSGMDDLADYNASEADDYRDEGINDGHEECGSCLGDE